VAFSLAGAVPERELAYAAEGYKDTTRVAGSDPNLWADIFLTNTDEIIKASRSFERYFKDIIKALSEKRYSKTVNMLRQLSRSAINSAMAKANSGLIIAIDGPAGSGKSTVSKLIAKIWASCI